MKNSYVIMMLALVFIMGVIFGFYSNTLKVSSSGVKIVRGNFVDGWEAARQKLLNSSEYSKNTNRLNGIVKEVQGNKIIFELNNSVTPLDNDSLKLRTAIISESSEVILRELKTEEEYEKDREEAQVEVNKLKSQLGVIEGEMVNCRKRTIDEKESLQCKASRKKYDEVQQEIKLFSQKMERYKIIKNASLSQIKLGSSIQVTAIVLDQEAKNAPGIIKGGMENIAEKNGFNVSSVSVREIDNEKRMKR